MAKSLNERPSSIRVEHTDRYTHYTDVKNKIVKNPLDWSLADWRDEYEELKGGVV